MQGGLFIKRQEPVPVMYTEVKLECGYRIDILVENLIVVELKCVDSLLPVHQAQILTYLKFSRKRLGLLINFNEALLKRGLRRFIL
ncbi:MAG: GxxExxY protein [Bacteroidota bacterium]